jgi:endoglucanase
MILNRFKKALLCGGILLLVVGAGVFATVKYLTSPRRDTPLVYATNAELLELWNDYKANNIEPSSHRTLDKSQNNITTSEGESYTMLRAVWMDDKTTFDQSWQFTQDNLQRKSDHLLSWKFGQQPNGSYGILTNAGGENTASDGDVDTALSLLMAYSRWNQTNYLYWAKQMISSIWAQEVVMVNGKPVLTADNLEQNSLTNVVVNPSYFSPYSFKIFAKVDPKDDWTGLTNNSYTLLSAFSKANLDKKSSTGLPPDWIAMDRTTGQFVPTTASNLDTNYGYDALRIPFRLALDYQWFKDPRDKAVLNQFGFLNQQWQKNQSIKAMYAHDGAVVGNYESPAMYGGAIGYFTVIHPATAQKIYQLKLQTLYSPDKQEWNTSLNYYDDNWAWFGIALTQHALPNLAEINH